MKVKIKYNSCVPRIIGRDGIILYPFIFITSSEKETKKTRLLHHEWIHVMQIRKCGFFYFYTSYISQAFFNLLKYRNLKKAYRNITFEKEAYSKEKKIKLPRELI